MDLDVYFNSTFHTGATQMKLKRTKKEEFLLCADIFIGEFQNIIFCFTTTNLFWKTFGKQIVRG